MKLEQVQGQIDIALVTATAEDKLAAIELAVLFDSEHTGQEMGKVAVHSILEQYKQNTTDTIRTKEHRQQGKGVMFITAVHARTYLAVASALGDYFGVTISLPESLEEYTLAATKIRNAIASHYSPRRPEVMFEYHEDVDTAAVQAQKRGDSLLEIDYSVPGTSYFLDIVRAVNANDK